MAQADYSIANQGFPATRADINSHLQAIATNNSGTSAPSTQYAGQFWIDTTSSTWTLYIHDGADDIQFATIDTSANTVNFIDSELGDNSVTTAKIADGNVTSAKLSYPLTTFSSTGIDDNATSTAITIDSSENVGIGTSSPATPLHVYNDNAVFRLQDTVDGVTASTSIQFWDSNSQMSTIGHLSSSNNDLDIFQSENAAIDFWTNSAQRMRIDSSGNIGIGTSIPSQKLDVVGSIEVSDGIYIGGTGTANKLDDYEEGTWTPVIQDNSANDATMDTSTTGTYTKIGNRVNLTARVQTTSVSGLGVDRIYIKTLPFNSSSGDEGYSAVMAGYGTGLNITAGQSIGLITEINQNRLRLRLWDETTGTSDLNSSEWSDDGQIWFSFTYLTN